MFIDQICFSMGTLSFRSISFDTKRYWKKKLYFVWLFVFGKFKMIQNDNYTKNYLKGSECMQDENCQSWS